MKTAIFDVDGTLVDSVDLHATAWQETLRHFGHEINFQEIRNQIGKGGDQFLPVFLNEEEVESRGEEVQKYRGELFMRDYMPQVKSFPSVRELFQKLTAEGWKLALASSAKKKELEIYKSIADITDLLDSEASSEDAHCSKPYPDIFLAAAQHLGSAPRECIVVGDTPYDATAAKRAGMSVIGVLSSGFSAAVLQNAGCEELFNDPSDLVERFEQSLFARSLNNNN